MLLWEASAATSTTSTSASAAAAAAAAGGETGGVDALLDDFRPILMELAVNLLGRGAASSTPAAAAADAARVLHVVSRAVRAVPHLAPLLLAHGGGNGSGSLGAATLRRVIGTIVSSDGVPPTPLGWRAVRDLIEDDGGRTMVAPLVRWTPLLRTLRAAVEERGGASDVALDAVRALSVLFGLDSSEAKAKLMSVLGSVSSDEIDRRVEESRREVTLTWRRRQSALWRQRDASGGGDGAFALASSSAADDADAELPLTAGLVSVEGVVVPAAGARGGESGRSEARAPFVRTAAARRALRSVMSALASERPLLIAGSAGCGKSTLVREAADATGATLIELHLDDSVDAKTMLGTYVCTQVPGEFKWQPGVLTRAARAGHWVLIEDIACAPFEVLSALTPLIESRHLELPGRGDTLVPHAHFRLLATLTTAGGSDGAQPRPLTTAVAGLLQGLWTRIRVAPIDPPALRTIVTSRFGALIPPGTREAIVLTYERFARGDGGKADDEADEVIGSSSSTGVAAAAMAPTPTPTPTPSPASMLRGAPVGPRDLIKWCERIAADASRLFPTLDGETRTFTSKVEKEDGDAAIWAELTRAMAIEHVTEVRRAEIIAAGVDVLIASCPSHRARLQRRARMHRWWGIAPPRLDDAPAVSVEMVALTNGGAAGASSGTQQILHVGRVALRLPRLLGVSAQWRADSGAATAAVGDLALADHTLRMLQRLAACVAMREPALMVGETGCGKTAMVQALAKKYGARLVVHNLSVQSDSSELLGGYRPVALRQIALPLLERFDELFARTFSRKKNASFVSSLHLALEKRRWAVLSSGFQSAAKKAAKKLRPKEPDAEATLDATAGGSKRRKEQSAGGESPSSKQRSAQSISTGAEFTQSPEIAEFGLRLWTVFARDAARFERQRLLSESPLAFRWAPGELVRALREGEWVLLDEINLAPAETLQRLAGLLDGADGTLTLPERVEGGGDDDEDAGGEGASRSTGIRVKRHPNFRIFAAMNPASDVGKRDLPPALRHRFTEIFVDEMLGVKDLCMVAQRCIRPLGLDRDQLGVYADMSVNFYLEMRNVVATRSTHGTSETKLAAEAQRRQASGPTAARMARVCAELRAVGISGASGSGQIPTFSLRTLCRAIALAVALVQRHDGDDGQRGVIGMAFYAGFNTCFASQLEAHIDDKSVKKLRNAMHLAFAPKLKEKHLARPFPAPREQAAGMIGGAANNERRQSKAERKARIEIETVEGSKYVKVEGVYLKAGPEPMRDLSQPDYEKRRPPQFVRTPSSSRVLQALARAAVLRDVPVLLQGPTSSGKTSTVKFLAALTGHRCIRINNHEHTELSEYIGSYGTDPHTGALAFREGPLVDAVRNGHWIVLDELNLAPSEVLEALNRLLDDNRELLIGETQQMIRAHPSFMLFATQNPSGGIYGGRKPLSRALRNRFIEIHVGDIPAEEMEVILQQRCCMSFDAVDGADGGLSGGNDGEARRLGANAPMAPEFCSALVDTQRALQLHRSRGEIFGGKHGFITPRDLLRWGGRPPLGDGSENAWHPRRDLAVTGYMLLAERLRREDERALVRSVLEEQCARKGKNGRPVVLPSDDEIYEITHRRLLPMLMSPQLRAAAASNASAASLSGDDQHKSTLSLLNAAATEAGLPPLAWSSAFVRLSALLGRCLLAGEPVLLVGATACGKTTLCQLYAALLGRKLRTVNCHQHTDASDIIGALRPVRNRADLDRRLLGGVTQLLALGEEEGSRASPTNADEAATVFSSWQKAKRKRRAKTAAGATDGEAPDEAAAKSAKRPRVSVAADDGAVIDEDEDDESIEEDAASIAAAVAVASLHAAEAAAAAARADVITAQQRILVADIKDVIRQRRAPFEWADGPLVKAMRAGEVLLLDEISLAEDAVIERLNPVLEPSRRILLAERPVGPTGVAEEVVAHGNFALVATMNPGGDFGKRELSPALRNRFTEIWVPALTRRTDLEMILAMRCTQHSGPSASAAGFAGPLEVRALLPQMLDFCSWHNRLFASTLNSSDADTSGPDFIGAGRGALTLRDMLAWVEFMLSHLDTCYVESMASGAVEAVLPAVASEEHAKDAMEEDEAVVTSASWTKKELNKMRVAELRALLEKRSLSTKGKKSLLVKRLLDIATAPKEAEEKEAVTLSTSTVASTTSTTSTPLGAAWSAYLHGAHLVALDGMGVGDLSNAYDDDADDDDVPSGEGESKQGPQSELQLRLSEAQRFFTTQLANAPDFDETERALVARTALVGVGSDLISKFDARTVDGHFFIQSSRARFGVTPFFIEPGPHALPELDASSDFVRRYALDAPTTASNVVRLLRGMRGKRRPIMLEGAPGVGKSSLVAALAAASGHKLVRINMSEQTDLADLLGGDLPLPEVDDDGEGSESDKGSAGAGMFGWCDGPLLRALKNGEWVLLDELNLAPQSVLEGLNALLDHRATVFLPALGRTFACPPSFRIFAAQNPLAQGGGRKGLPHSFTNRFTRVRVAGLSIRDMQHIVERMYSAPTDATYIVPTVVERMIRFNQACRRLTSGAFNSARVLSEVGVDVAMIPAGPVGQLGGPWDFNLRDVFRWCELCKSYGNALPPSAFVRTIYLSRMRTRADSDALLHLFNAIFTGSEDAMSNHADLRLRVTPSFVALGTACIARSATAHNDAATKSSAASSALTLASSAAAKGSKKRGRDGGRDEDRDDRVAAANVMDSETALTLASHFPALGVAGSSGDGAFVVPPVLSSLLQPLEHVMHCVAMGWPALLVGVSASGKTTLVHLLAALTRRRVHRIALSPSVDAAELLGCWEQGDPTRSLRTAFGQCSTLAWHASAYFVLAAGAAEKGGSSARATALLRHSEIVMDSWWALYQRTQSTNAFDAERSTSIDGTKRLSPLQSSGKQAQHLLQIISSSLAQADGGNKAQLQREATRLAVELVRLVRKCDAAASGTKKKRQIFEWVDSPLVKAMIAGDWVLLENVNHCSPTVLDRLNPLLERQGEGGSSNGLAIHECGPVRVKKGKMKTTSTKAEQARDAAKRAKTDANASEHGEVAEVETEIRNVVPHRNFRLFMSMDPLHGELSRAFRNRCVEVALSPAHVSAADAINRDSNNTAEGAAAERDDRDNCIGSVEAHDALASLGAEGIETPAALEMLVRVHKRAVRYHRVSPSGEQVPSWRSLVQWAGVVLSRLRQGDASLHTSGVRGVMRVSFEEQYGLPGFSDGDDDRAAIESSTELAAVHALFSREESSALAPLVLLPSAWTPPQPLTEGWGGWTIRRDGALLEHLLSIAAKTEAGGYELLQQRRCAESSFARALLPSTLCSSDTESVDDFERRRRALLPHALQWMSLHASLSSSDWAKRGRWVAAVDVDGATMSSLYTHIAARLTQGKSAAESTLVQLRAAWLAALEATEPTANSASSAALREVLLNTPWVLLSDKSTSLIAQISARCSSEEVLQRAQRLQAMCRIRFDWHAVEWSQQLRLDAAETWAGVELTSESDPDRVFSLSALQLSYLLQRALVPTSVLRHPSLFPDAALHASSAAPSSLASDADDGGDRWVGNGARARAAAVRALHLLYPALKALDSVLDGMCVHFEGDGHGDVTLIEALLQHRHELWRCADALTVDLQSIRSNDAAASSSSSLGLSGLAVLRVQWRWTVKSISRCDSTIDTDSDEWHNFLATAHELTRTIFPSATSLSEARSETEGGIDALLAASSGAGKNTLWKQAHPAVPPRVDVALAGALLSAYSGMMAMSVPARSLLFGQKTSGGNRAAAKVRNAVLRDGIFCEFDAASLLRSALQAGEGALDTKHISVGPTAALPDAAFATTMHRSSGGCGVSGVLSSEPTPGLSLAPLIRCLLVDPSATKEEAASDPVPTLGLSVLCARASDRRTALQALCTVRRANDGTTETLSASMVAQLPRLVATRIAECGAWIDRTVASGCLLLQHPDRVVSGSALDRLAGIETVELVQVLNSLPQAGRSDDETITVDAKDDGNDEARNASQNEMLWIMPEMIRQRWALCLLWPIEEHTASNNEGVAISAFLAAWNAVHRLLFDARALTGAALSESDVVGFTEKERVAIEALESASHVLSRSVRMWTDGHAMDIASGPAVLALPPPPRSPATLVALQLAAWCCEAIAVQWRKSFAGVASSVPVDVATCSASALERLSPLVSELMMRWHDRHWTATFNAAQLTNGISTTMGLSCAPSSETVAARRAIVGGPSRLFDDVCREWAMSCVESMSAALMSEHAARRGLHFVTITSSAGALAIARSNSTTSSCALMDSVARMMQLRAATLHVLAHAPEEPSAASPRPTSLPPPTIDTKLLWSLVEHTIRCFILKLKSGATAAFDGANCAAIEDALHTLCGCVDVMSSSSSTNAADLSSTVATTAVDTLEAMLAQCSDARMRAMCPTLLIPCLRRMFGRYPHRTSLYERAIAWVEIGLLRLQALVPVLPHDPASKPALKLWLVAGQSEEGSGNSSCNLADAETRLDAWRSCAQLWSGDAFDVLNSSTLVRSQSDHVERLRGEARLLRERVVWRPSQDGADGASRSFSALYDTVHSFGSTVGAIEKVQGVMAPILGMLSFEKRASPSDAASRRAWREEQSSALRREGDWQEAARSFQEKLQQQWPHYRDVAWPISGAVGHISHGIRMLGALLAKTTAEHAASRSGSATILSHAPTAITPDDLLVFPHPAACDDNVIAGSSHNFEQLIAAIFPTSTTVGVAQIGGRARTRLLRVLLARLTMAVRCCKKEDADEMIERSKTREFATRTLSMLVAEWKDARKVRAAYEAEASAAFKVLASKRAVAVIEDATIDGQDASIVDAEAAADFKLRFPDFGGAIEASARVNEDDLNDEVELVDAATADAEEDAEEERISSATDPLPVRVLEEFSEEIFMLYQILAGAHASAGEGGVSDIDDDERVWSVVCAVDAAASLPQSKHSTGAEASVATMGGKLAALAACAALSCGKTRGDRAASDSGNPFLPGLIDGSDAAVQRRKRMEERRKRRSRMKRGKKLKKRSADESIVASGSTALSFDFYRSAAAAEVRLLFEPLRVIETRVMVLLQQWPENAVLQDILFIIDLVLRIPLPSPIAAALQSLEIVLNRIASWDRQASKRAQIDLPFERIHDAPLLDHALEGEARAAATAELEVQVGDTTIAGPLLFLVERWRKIELRSWDDLLRGEDERSAAEGRRWWFHLHSACTVALENTSDQEGLGEVHTAQLFETVTQMLRNAPMGEFATRLDLVRTSALYARRAYIEGRCGSDDAARVLYNLHAHYDQYSDILRLRREGERATMQGEMKKTARLARWVDAKKAASDKGSWLQLHDASMRAHRALHKIVRQYREEVLLDTVARKIDAALNLSRDRDADVPDITTQTIALGAEYPDISASKCIARLCIERAGSGASAAEGGAALDGAVQPLIVAFSGDEGNISELHSSFYARIVSGQLVRRLRKHVVSSTPRSAGGDTGNAPPPLASERHTMARAADDMASTIIRTRLNLMKRTDDAVSELTAKRRMLARDAIDEVVGEDGKVTSVGKPATTSLETDEEYEARKAAALSALGLIKTAKRSRLVDLLKGLDASGISHSFRIVEDEEEGEADAEEGLESDRALRRSFLSDLPHSNFVLPCKEMPFVQMMGHGAFVDASALWRTEWSRGERYWHRAMAQLHALRLQAAEGASADIGFARGRRFVALAEHIHELVTHHRRSVSLAVETAAMARRTATHLVQLSAALEEAVSSESVDEMQDELQDAAAATDESAVEHPTLSLSWLTHTQALSCLHEALAQLRVLIAGVRQVVGALDTSGLNDATVAKASRADTRADDCVGAMDATTAAAIDENGASCESAAVAAIACAAVCCEGAQALRRTIDDEMADFPDALLVSLPRVRSAVALHAREVRKLIEHCHALARCSSRDGTITVLPGAVTASALKEPLRRATETLVQCVRNFGTTRPSSSVDAIGSSAPTSDGVASTVVSLFDGAVESALLCVQQSRTYHIWLRTRGDEEESAEDAAGAGADAGDDEKLEALPEVRVAHHAILAHHRRMCGPLTRGTRARSADAALARSKGLVRSVETHVSAFKSSVDALLDVASHGGSSSAGSIAARDAQDVGVIVAGVAADLAPFALALARTTAQTAEEAVTGLSSLCKLEFIIARTFRALLLDGFCDPNSNALQQEAANEDFNAGGDDSTGGGAGGGDDGGDDDNLEDGTGMGDGEGMTDVTDQIQDEQQLVGAEQQAEEGNEDGGKDAGAEEEEQEQQDKVDQDDGMEMEEEFEGDLRSTEDQEDPDDEDDKEQPEDDMGELDDDEGDVVDEKLWGEDSDDEDELPPPDPNDDKKEKFEEDAPVKGAALDEMRTRDEGEEDQQEKANEDQQGKQDEDQRDEEEEAAGDDEKSDEEDEGEEADGQVNEDLEELREDKNLGAEVGDGAEDEVEEEAEDGSDREGEEEGEDPEGDDRAEDPPAPGADDEGGEEGGENVEDDAMPEDIGDLPAFDDEEDGPEDDGGDEEGANHGGEEDEDNLDGAEPEAPPVTAEGDVEDAAEEKEEDEEEEEEDDAAKAEQGASNALSADQQPADSTAADAQQTTGGGARDPSDAKDDAKDEDDDEKEEDDDDDADAEAASAASQANAEEDAEEDGDADARPEEDEEMGQGKAEKNASSGGGGSDGQWQRGYDDSSKPDPSSRKERRPPPPPPKLTNPELDPAAAMRHWRDEFKKMAQKDSPSGDDDEGAEEESQPAPEKPESGDMERGASAMALDDGPNEDGGPVETVLARASQAEVDDDEVDDAEDDEGIGGKEEGDGEDEDEEDPEHAVVKPGDEGAAEDDDAMEADDGVGGEGGAENDSEGGDDDEEEIVAEAHSSKVSKKQQRPAAGAESGAKGDAFDESDDEEEEDDAEKDGADPDAGWDGRGIEARDLAVTDAQTQQHEHDARGAAEEEEVLPTLEEMIAASAAKSAELRSELDLMWGDRLDGRDALQRGAALWQKYRSLTAAGAASLCEQLRMLLEPLEATRLAGDYRTGKRLNIRRVIPYIASNFRRDRIWLRRSKPAKRSYQIAIAIDDTESMGEATTGGGKVALEALSMVTGALRRLEADSDLALLSFGKKPRLLHPLGRGPLTDADAAKAMASFTFGEQATEHAFTGALEALISMFVDAKASGGAKSSAATSGIGTKHTQLAFVISDGRLDATKRSDVRQWTAAAAAVGVLLLLIIINPNEKGKEDGDIHALQTIEFTETGIENKVRSLGSNATQAHSLLHTSLTYPTIPLFSLFLSPLSSLFAGIFGGLPLPVLPRAEGCKAAS